MSNTSLTIEELRALAAKHGVKVNESPELTSEDLEAQAKPQYGDGGKAYDASQYGQQFGRAVRVVPPQPMDTDKPGLYFVDKEQWENHYRTASRAIVDKVEREEEDFSYATYAQAWTDNLAYDFVSCPDPLSVLSSVRGNGNSVRGKVDAFWNGSATKGYTKRGKRVETGLRILALIGVAGGTVGTFAVWVLIYAST